MTYLGLHAAAAPRAGGRRHRRAPMAAGCARTGPWGWSPTASRPGFSSGYRPRRHRPRPLRHRRQLGAAQRAAALRRVRPRRDVAGGTTATWSTAAELRSRLEAAGSIFQSSSDTEVIIHLIAHARETDTVDRVVSALRQSRGAYSAALPHRDQDDRGARPLRVPAAGARQAARLVRLRLGDLRLRPQSRPSFIRELEPGEMVVVDHSGMRSLRPFPAPPAGERFCVFEHVYFARPDSRIKRPLGLPGARAARPPAGQGAPGRRRRGGPGARQRHRRRHRLRARERHPLRHGAHPLALRRPDLHRAAAVHSATSASSSSSTPSARCWRASGLSSSTTRSCAAPPRARS